MRSPCTDQLSLTRSYGSHHKWLNYSSIILQINPRYNHSRYDLTLYILLLNLLSLTISTPCTHLVAAQTQLPWHSHSLIHVTQDIHTWGSVKEAASAHFFSIHPTHFGSSVSLRKQSPQTECKLIECNMINTWRVDHNHKEHEDEILNCS